MLSYQVLTVKTMVGETKKPGRENQSLGCRQRNQVAKGRGDLGE